MAQQMPARQRKPAAHFRQDDIDIAPNTLRPLNRPPLSRGIAMSADIHQAHRERWLGGQLARKNVIPGGAVHPAAVIHHHHVFTRGSLPIQAIAQSLNATGRHLHMPARPLAVRLRLLNIAVKINQSAPFHDVVGISYGREPCRHADKHMKQQ